MKRTFCKGLIVLVLWVAMFVAVQLIAGEQISNGWIADIGGGLGALLLMTAPNWFDRLWPKPKAGWSK